ncbi:PHA/PHB synthase family protein [Legionella tunisiensis]|uniref:PHA/PHB synthase family protein n=1 Tax=Legionella tunisiensis TaxID=1034944 RepID=UPI0002DCD06D|nr:poly-beta-hydroxybutyrate polymerase N-terminal domain-containing protein [Legionella tunisiensis]
MDNIKKKIKNCKKFNEKRLDSVSPELNQPESSGLNFDKMFHASLSKFGSWLSSAILLVSYTDWLANLSLSPARQQELRVNVIKKLGRFLFYVSQQGLDKSCEPCIPVRQTDHRFHDEQWNQYPFNIYSQFFLLTEQWWDEATSTLRGVSKHHQTIVNFITRQILDTFSPSNIPWMNPEVIAAAISEGGTNFINGWNNYIEDIARNLNNKPPVGTEQFKVGENVAVTPGKVIYRNRLIELIQYEPTTSEVYAEPVLIVPAWIMKYYILDLSPHNSMVKYLIEKGHTVFMISWKNPTSEDRNLGLSDYISLGIMDALDAISQIIPQKKFIQLAIVLAELY